MHLSTTQSRALRDVMRLLAEAADADQLRELLALPMLELMGADTYVSMAWNSQVQRFERVKALNMSPGNLRTWDEHFRFIDPLTFPMMERRSPTVATQILCQRDLARTEFFNDFLLRDRMHWGVNVYFYAGEECIGDFRIWRQRERSNFEANDLEILRLVEPAITAALGRLRKASAGAAAPDVTARIEDLLQRRGRLSQREAQVAWLVSCGCTDKQIARQLTLGFPTVRFHLGNAFRKLQADNRTTLATRVQSLVDD
ncbi:MAG: Helix-turn-helix transcriptional regulator [Ramlibacter sp.]|jgi:DNA-binding CsgD family transcriptional regulator|nr:Helix-turn-helix transcriptional regulator [Ramlibacter sp.]